MEFSVQKSAWEEYATFVDMFDYISRIPFSIEFYNSTADFAGTTVYGSLVSSLKVSCQLSMILNLLSSPIYMPSVVDSFFHYHYPAQQLSIISSNPTRVCLCITSIPDCSITEYTVTAYPGQTLTIIAVAGGQRFGTVPSIVQSSIVPRSNDILPELQYKQLVYVNLHTLFCHHPIKPKR